MASVVHTQLLQVGGRTYRLRAEPIGSRPGGGGGEDDEGNWAEEQEPELQQEDELIDDALIKQEGNSYVTTISVDSQVLPFVVGKEAHKKKEIEAATGATLAIPRPAPRAPPSRQQQQQQQQQVLGAARSETITIKARSKAALSSARVRTELLISGAISSRLLDWTHFVSLPLADERTTARLLEFQQKVLAQPGAQEAGFDPSIFINPKTLHLTLLMLKLYSDEARSQARQVLADLEPEVRQLLGRQPLTLQLSGLDHMTDDPTDMHVLYLRVQDLGPGQRLAALCDLVIGKFRDAGLMLPGQPEALKLHATIINTRHRRQPRGAAAGDDGGGGGYDGGQQGKHPPRRQQQQRIGFDGRRLLQDWAALDLGRLDLPAVHLSQRGAYGPEGYYACAASLSLGPRG